MITFYGIKLKLLFKEKLPFNPASNNFLCMNDYSNQNWLFCEILEFCRATFAEFFGTNNPFESFFNTGTSGPGSGGTGFGDLLDDHVSIN